jgi:hypothetical protein
VSSPHREPNGDKDAFDGGDSGDDVMGTGDPTGEDASVSGEPAESGSAGDDFDEADEGDAAGEEDVGAAVWCPTCERDVTPGELDEDGRCPGCGNRLASQRRIPWTFKFMLAATVVYLGYRMYQGITWVVHHA